MPSKWIKVFVLAMLSLMGGVFANEPIPPKPFQDGDRWCVLGDSITRSGQYHQYVELFYLTRFPSQKLNVINCGISGDTAPGALRRLQWDCLEKKPNVVSVMLGMNDVMPGLYAPGVDEKRREQAAITYDAAMRQLTQSFLKSGVTVILMTPSIFDDTANLPAKNYSGCGAALAGFANRVRAMAEEFKVSLVDFNTPMTAINAERQKINPRFTVVGGDRIHPTSPGHLVMAYEFLRAQGLNGVVSRIAINASSQKVGVLENCALNDLQINDGEIVFSCLENALPFPVEASARSALELVPFSRELNQQILSVQGLDKGDYALSIDGKEIRTFTAAKFAEGINLAEEAHTPQAQQSQAVLAALQKKWAVVAKLRNLAVCEHTSWPDAPRPIDMDQISAKLDLRLERAKNSPAVKEAHRQYLECKPREGELLREVEDAVQTARKVALPKPHIFTLRRIIDVKP